MNISECIKRIRFNAGLNQSDFARAVNINNVSMCMYENGKRKPSFPSIKKIVDFANRNGMNITFSDLNI